MRRQRLTFGQSWISVDKENTAKHEANIVAVTSSSAAIRERGHQVAMHEYRWMIYNILEGYSNQNTFIGNHFHKINATIFWYLRHKEYWKACECV